ncbi:uncharacterized protein [Oscarella lobularis]|uniref:uncharacterized protein n=1 Tax=Oscarella lobularis TaxID=121494 RepID=UPI003313305D
MLISGMLFRGRMSKKKKQDAAKTSPVYGFVASDAKSKAESTLNSDIAREEGKELWLIRVPYNTDLTALRGAVIREKKTVNIKTKGGENKDCDVQITGIGKRSPPDKIGLVPNNSSPLLSQGTSLIFER